MNINRINQINLIYLIYIILVEMNTFIPTIKYNINGVPIYSCDKCNLVSRTFVVKTKLPIHFCNTLICPFMDYIPIENNEDLQMINNIIKEENEF